MPLPKEALEEIKEHIRTAELSLKDVEDVISDLKTSGLLVPENLAAQTINLRLTLEQWKGFLARQEVR